MDLYEKLGNLLNEKIEKDEDFLSENKKKDEKAGDELKQKGRNDENGIKEPDAVLRNQGRKYENASKNDENDIISQIQKHHSEKIKKIIKKNNDIPTGEVIKNEMYSSFYGDSKIKMYNYAIFMQFPKEIQNALTTLDVAHPYKWSDIKKQYRIIMKKLHPDKLNTTIQTSETVLNFRQYNINTIQQAYQILKQYFKKR